MTMSLETLEARVEVLERLLLRKRAEEIRAAKEPTPPVVVEGIDDLMAQAKTLPPDVKVKLIQAMGFTAMGDDHDWDCDGRPGSGIRCNCVPPATWWNAPKDVDVHRKETWEDRVALANEWESKGSHGRSR